MQCLHFFLSIRIFFLKFSFYGECRNASQTCCYRDQAIFYDSCVCNQNSVDTFDDDNINQQCTCMFDNESCGNFRINYQFSKQM